jgi:PBP1b-binding outer membrane lipoprotein LpoB
MKKTILMAVAITALLVSCKKDEATTISTLPAATTITANASINNTTSYNQYTQNRLYIDLSTVIPTSASGYNYWGDAYNARAYADFNKDGNLDIIAVCPSINSTPGNDVEYYSNNGTSFVQDQTVFSNGIPQYVHGRKAIVGDFDNNGWLDVIIAGHGWDQNPFPGEQLKMMLNFNGKFTTSTLAMSAAFYHSVCAGDIDNDGDLDLFVTDGKSIGKFLINDGKGNFTYDSNIFPDGLNARGGFYTSELYDINKDGFLDLVVAGHEQDNAKSAILWGSNKLRYNKDNVTILPAVTGNGVVIDIDFIDFDKDGQTDMVLNRTGDGTINNPPYQGFYSNYYVQILKNNNGSFTDVSTTAMPINSVPFSSSITKYNWVNWFRVQDINNDGWTDITSDDKYYNLSWVNNNGIFVKQ